MAKRTPQPDDGLSITIPRLPDLDSGYRPIHLDLHLTPEESALMRRLFLAFDRDGARLSDERRVTYHADVVRRLLQQIGEADAAR